MSVWREGEGYQPEGKRKPPEFSRSEWATIAGELNYQWGFLMSEAMEQAESGDRERAYTLKEEADELAKLHWRIFAYLVDSQWRTGEQDG